jgi:hypothetical protein
MAIGTVSDFDVDRRFGVINADDGRYLLFNLRETPAELRDLFKVGTRAKFTERESNSITRAVALLPIKPVVRE